MSIHLRHAAACYQAPDGEVEAVRDVSFDVAQGEFVSLVGPSGCGKSTLLSAIAGLEPLTGGTVNVAGQPVTGPSALGSCPSGISCLSGRASGTT